MSFRSVLMMIILRMPADKHLLRCHCNRKKCFEINSHVRMKMKISHTWQKEHNDHGVDDGEPVDLHVTHGEVCVPARRPFHFTLLQWRREQLFIKPNKTGRLLDGGGDASYLPAHRVSEENAVLFGWVDLLRDGGNCFRQCACASLICFYI